MSLHLFFHIYVQIVDFFLCSGWSSKLFVAFYWSRLAFSLSYQLVLIPTLDDFYGCDICSLLLLLILFWDELGDFFDEISWELLSNNRVGFWSFDFEWIGSTGPSDEFKLGIGVGDLWVFIGYEFSVDSFKHKMRWFYFYSNSITNKFILKHLSWFISFNPTN